MILQQKTQRPVQFELTAQTREAIGTWIRLAGLVAADFLFPSQLPTSLHVSRRQYARIVESWVTGIGLDPAQYGTHSLRIGLDPAKYGTHSLRRSKASLIYRRTKNLRAVQLLLGHAKLESTVRYLGIEVDDALELAEQTDV
jgi:integrase